MSDEILGLRLNTIHNLHFLLNLMCDIRQAILEGRFPAFKEAFLSRYRIADPKAREASRRTWEERNKT